MSTFIGAIFLWALYKMSTFIGATYSKWTKRFDFQIAREHTEERQKDPGKSTTCHVLIRTPFSVLEINAPSTIISWTSAHESNFPNLPMLKETDYNYLRFSSHTVLICVFLPYTMARPTDNISDFDLRRIVDYRDAVVSWIQNFKNTIN